MSQAGIGAILLTTVLALTNGCSGPLLVRDGELLRITRSAPGRDADETAPGRPVRIGWLGTACYFVQFGEVALMTDPYFTHHSLGQVGFGRIRSDPELVERKTGKLPTPQAIFVGHTHYDHTLDLAEMISQRRWDEVPIYGSRSLGNLLCGYGGRLACQCRAALTDRQWQAVGPGLEYQAICSEHAPQLDGILLYAGQIERPLKTPPRRAADFRVGDTYAYLYRLSQGARQFTIYFADAAAKPPLGFPDVAVEHVDLAILCVPGWRNVHGYPREIIRRLRPRYILLSHYDDFFQTDCGRTREVPTADLAAFIRIVQDCADYPEFESILVPGVDAVMQIAAFAAQPRAAER